MAVKKVINVALNRVEGDLELKVEIEDGVVIDAFSSGTMYRGFENMLIGREALDSLVITPRICGICTSAHLNAAAKALDMIANASLPANSLIVRNLTMAAEHIQSDVRHCFMMFMVDMINPKYQKYSFFDEAVKRYQPFMGDTAISVIKETKKLLEVIAILGGQWPHSSHIVPGGITSLPKQSDIFLCSSILTTFQKWYENRVLGCSTERWQDVNSLKELDLWLNENDSHRNSELGFFIRSAREAGLDKIGKGSENFISFGSFDLPNGETQLPSGFMRKDKLEAFDNENISEHVAYSRFKNYEGGKHPYCGETNPISTGANDLKYSWCKAPRYRDLPAETGPLAEMLISGHALLSDMFKQQGGSNVMLRQLARLIRPADVLPAACAWLKQISFNSPFYNTVDPIENGEGFGITQASRGALGHWVKIADSRIAHYQIITPTAWNASPRDSNGVKGPWEEALVGTTITNPDDPVELGHVIRSFDACLVCSVHTIYNKLGYSPSAAGKYAMY